jgi:hypothetical protein
VPEEPVSSKPDAIPHAFLDELRSLNPDSLRPIDALQKLAEWKLRLESGET